MTGQDRFACASLRKRFLSITPQHNKEITKHIILTKLKNMWLYEFSHLVVCISQIIMHDTTLISKMTNWKVKFNSSWPLLKLWILTVNGFLRTQNINKKNLTVNLRGNGFWGGAWIRVNWATYSKFANRGLKGDLCVGRERLQECFADVLHIWRTLWVFWHNSGWSLGLKIKTIR